MSKRVYFITGGGTGGHIYPAVAVADELLKDENSLIFYLGNPKNMEAQIVRNKGYVFLSVESSGMPRKFGLELISWAFKLLLAWLWCCSYIKKYNPNVIFGTGGYVSAPVMLAAMAMKVPFIMHDCDAKPGLVTRKLAPYAESVSVAFEAAKSMLKNDKIFVNGNPIRNEFETLTKEEAKNRMGLDERLTLCVMGGSQGAVSINQAFIPIIKTLSKDYNIQIIFQTGKKNYNDACKQLQNVYPEYENDENLIIRPYFDNMVDVLKSSDIAVSRAGSLSISELCASEVATIFIPYPYAAADHQRKNAKFIEENGAGLYLEDGDTNSEKLLKMIKSLIENPQKLNEIKSNAKKLAKYDGVQKIARQIFSI